MRILNVTHVFLQKQIASLQIIASQILDNSSGKKFQSTAEGQMCHAAPSVAGVVIWVLRQIHA